MIVDPNADDWFILVQRVFSSLVSTLWCGYRSLIGHFSVAFVVWKISLNSLLVALLLARSWSILHIMLTIQDFFSLFVDFLMLIILYILMESGRAVQQRQPARINEQREQVRRSELNRSGERRRQREENQNYCVPPNTNYPTENDERQG